MNGKDNLIQTGKWQFNNDVSKCFDNMLERSIPDYKNMRHLVYSLACRYYKHNTNIIDLGCSHAETLRALAERYGAYCKYYGYEISDSMINIAKEKAKDWINSKLMFIEKLDLRKEFPNINAQIILSILTLEFIPIEYRQGIVQNIYNNLLDNGVFIFVAKVLGNTQEIDNILIEEYYKLKKENGYSKEQIDRKKLSLEGVLVPIKSDWNYNLLQDVGFKKIDCFWRYLNFSAWIAIK